MQLSTESLIYLATNVSESDHQGVIKIAEIIFRASPAVDGANNNECDLDSVLTALNIYLSGHTVIARPDHGSGDMLAEMMSQQGKFIKRFGHGSCFSAQGELLVTPERLTALHAEYAVPVMMDGAELMDWVAWKHWSKKSGNKEVDHVQMFNGWHTSEIKMELIDILKFTLSLAIIYGMNAEEVADRFQSKGDTNIDRQETGVY